MADEDDITSDWGTIKNIPKAKAGSTEDVDLRMDILDTRQQHPEFIYRVYEGYGLDSMALWRCRCHAKRKLNNGWRGYASVKEIYLYSMEERLASGPRYEDKEAANYVGKTYSGACKAFYTTLEEAVARWEAIKQRHIKSLREQAARHRQESAERLQWAEDAEARATEAETTPLKL